MVAVSRLAVPQRLLQQPTPDTRTKGIVMIAGLKTVQAPPAAAAMREKLHH
jgi:hypothetical protein